jgi:hypothetical protein
MSIFRLKAIRTSQPKRNGRTPNYFGTIRADKYAETFREPRVQETLERVAAKRAGKPQR